jgi:hypothetical protein
MVLPDEKNRDPTHDIKNDIAQPLSDSQVAQTSPPP